MDAACAFLELEEAAIVHLVDRNPEPPGWTPSPEADPSLSLSDCSVRYMLSCDQQLFKSIAWMNDVKCHRLKLCPEVIHAHCLPPHRGNTNGIPRASRRRGNPTGGNLAAHS